MSAGDDEELLMGLDSMDLVIDKNTQTVKWVEKPKVESLRKGYAVPTAAGSWNPDPRPYVSDKRDSMFGIMKAGNYGRRSRIVSESEHGEVSAVELSDEEKQKLTVCSEPHNCMCEVCRSSGPESVAPCGCRIHKPLPKVVLLKKPSWLQKLIDYFFW